MSNDPLVRAAIAHWGPRFVASGVPLSDFQDVTAEIDRWDDWCRAWSTRAAVHEGLAETALAGGHHLTAGELFGTAALCYHFGKFLFVHDTEQMRQAHRRAVACRTAALRYLQPPGERVEIPYQGTVIPGFLRRPPGVATPPVVLLVAGLDSTKEEMESREMRFLARGLATLSFDGPGQGELEYELPIRADYEVVVSAVMDWVGSQQDLDATRIGLWGVSLGGYYAPRAAAFESRIKACVALAGPYTLADHWVGLPTLTREAFRVRSHLDNALDAVEHARSLSLHGLPSRIRCPLLVVFGKQDRLFSYRDAERLVAEAGGPAELWLVGDGNHAVANRTYRHLSQCADWVADRLQVPG
ncbi:MAG TPA: alpha/beta fold hydrolase [Jiangellales bacterium]|nr:alpha/beta fold hydrolase [Jiangellales bacterium]